MKNNVLTFETFTDESIKNEYLIFIATQKGTNWVKKCISINMSGDFGDYLYDFYPEYIA